MDELDQYKKQECPVYGEDCPMMVCTHRKSQEECLCFIHPDGCLLCANGKHNEHCRKPDQPEKKELCNCNSAPGIPHMHPKHKCGECMRDYDDQPTERLLQSMKRAKENRTLGKASPVFDTVKEMKEWVENQPTESWEEEFAKLMAVVEIGNIKLMRSNNFLVAIGFVRSLLAQEQDKARIEGGIAENKRLSELYGNQLDIERIAEREKIKQELIKKLEEMIVKENKFLVEFKGKEVEKHKWHNAKKIALFDAIEAIKQM